MLSPSPRRGDIWRIDAGISVLVISSTVYNEIPSEPTVIVVPVFAIEPDTGCWSVGARRSGWSVGWRGRCARRRRATMGVAILSGGSGGRIGRRRWGCALRVVVATSRSVRPVRSGSVPARRPGIRSSVGVWSVVPVPDRRSWCSFRRRSRRHRVVVVGSPVAHHGFGGVGRFRHSGCFRVRCSGITGQAPGSGSGVQGGGWADAHRALFGAGDPQVL